jgi:signal transduction histidine kinase
MIEGKRIMSQSIPRNKQKKAYFMAVPQANSASHSHQCADLFHTAAEYLWATTDLFSEGLGIPAHQQVHLFERFVRGENVQQIGGNGLGLYLSRMLIELQGGRIWFESQEGAGSTFFLAFPLPAHAQQHKS